jgi:hypothetical protein
MWCQRKRPICLRRVSESTNSAEHGQAKVDARIMGKVDSETGQDDLLELVRQNKFDTSALFLAILPQFRVVVEIISLLAWLGGQWFCHIVGELSAKLSLTEHRPHS